MLRFVCANLCGSCMECYSCRIAPAVKLLDCGAFDSEVQYSGTFTNNSLLATKPRAVTSMNLFKAPE